MPKSSKNIIVFEDEAALSLEPLSLTRPVWDLRCGLKTLAQKIQAAFADATISFLGRAYLQEAFGKAFAPADLDKENALWLNGALLPGDGLSAALDLAVGSAWIQDGRLVAFRGPPTGNWQPGTPLPADRFDNMEAPPQAGKLIRYPWDLVHAMNGEIVLEARRFRKLGEIKGELHPASVWICPEETYVASGSKIGPGAVLDASLGPIVLDEAVQIGAHAVIEGPTYLGPRVQIKPLTHIRGSCLGEDSRVGGEISVSIMHGYSNKQHGGFLGHSYIGAWCNLGSGTETSNLKNNYSPVKVEVGGRLVDTGQLFVGLTMGDHSKTAIGTVFNTGTVVGTACNIFGSGFGPRFIPSFSWGGADKLTRYPLNRTLEIARAALSRRGQELTEEDIKVLRWIYENRS